MKAKKFLATLVTSALIASSMVMPAMAADQGSVDIDVTVKTGVVRVEVPTNMAVAIDQFEITQAGAQLASGTFDMVNKSEMNVKVDVTSTVTLGSGVELAPSVGAVSVSDGDAVAWLGVAAMTAASSYDDLTTTATENYWNLTEANANVATFANDGSANTAKQTFYLGKSVSGNDAVEAVYKMSIPATPGEANQSYAQYYKLTEITPADQTAIDNKLKTEDVYSAAAEADEEAMVKTEKGDTLTFVAGTKYYTAAATPTPVASLTAAPYVYASMTGEGGKAGFTYVAKLANKADPWTGADIDEISISYTITGVTATVYDEVSPNCTYGLYKEGPAIAVSSSGLITITGLTAAKNYKSITITNDNGTFDIDEAPVEWNAENWNATTGGDLTGQLGTDWMNSLYGKTASMTITFTDNTTATKTFSIPSR